MILPTNTTDFPYASRYLEVAGAKMHFIEEGTGDPILFLHGNPTSVYLWRNIIPYLTDHARCIAVDLIGMGQSDKPDIPYRFEDHYHYLEGFIESMGLENLTLVVHDWGSGLGFHYASRHPEKIRAIAFMEAIYRPMKWTAFPFQFKLAFRMMRTPYLGWLFISFFNGFVNTIMPMAIVRKLSAAEQRAYQVPFPTAESRKPIRQWPLEIPIDGHPARMHRIVTDYSNWLRKSPHPKLLLHAQPGGLITESDRKWLEAELPNLLSVPIGAGLHYVQEDQPEAIGTALANWYTKLESSNT